MTVYTAIFGNYDDLKEPLVITPGWKYICFTDDASLKSEVWEIKVVPVMFGGFRLTSKYYKIMFHLVIEDARSIWVDASFYINCNLTDWWSKRFIGPMTLMQHPARNCVYEEAKACIRNRRDVPELILKQINLYQNLGLPKNNGMAASGIMMREKNRSSMQFAGIWYKEVLDFCKRDQIGYAYANWHVPIAHLTDYNYRTGTDFLIMPHLNKPEKRKAKLSHYKSLNLL